MGIIANMKAWLKAMRGGSQARNMEEAAKRNAEWDKANLVKKTEEEKAARSARIAANVAKNPGSTDITTGP